MCSCRRPIRSPPGAKPRASRRATQRSSTARTNITRRALRLKAAAAAEVDLQVSVCGEGAMVLAWTNGVAASSLARAVVVPADDSPQLVDGVTVSAFPVARLAQEVLSHLPSGGSTPDGVRAAAIAPDLARELVVALRSAMTPPPQPSPTEPIPCGAAPARLARDGAHRGRPASSSAVSAAHVRLRLVLCEAGWVEIHATADGRLAHTPYDTDGLLELLRRELAAQLSAAASPEISWLVWPVNAERCS
jgi:hypothetical protein